MAHLLVTLLSLSAILPLALTDLIKPQSPLSFRGVYGSNFNETIFFCSPPPKSFELNEWHIITTLAQSIDSGQSVYNNKGAILSGGTYIAPNGSVIWKGLGFSANGPYDCAFALSPDGKEADGFYTFLDEKNATVPAGETGPWLLYYQRVPTEEECKAVLRYPKKH